MIIRKTKKALIKSLSEYSEFSIGFVPTMGALHKGHLALLNEAKKQTSLVVCSIFVNPTQFTSQMDFKSYPNTITEDLTLLEKINCDIVYLPEVDDLYKKNESAKKYDFGNLTVNMEGEFRPGHFNGVATIVEKLLMIVKPHKAFFGEKDFQQLLIIKCLVKKLELNTEIIGLPTIRESSGLAMSSRNNLLNKKGREKADLLYESLLFCKQNKHRMPLLEMKKKISAKLSNAQINLEYLIFADANSLKSIAEFNPEVKTVACIAAYIEGIRLIDNIIL